MGEKEQVSRREFMRGAATAAAGAAVGAAAVSRVARADVYKSILPQTIIGANEIIRTGHIGVGGMGFRNLSEFVLRRDDMQPIAICDLYPVHLDRAVNEVKKKFDKTPPSAHHDFREIIANKDVDAVIVCTPDHWHAIPSIMACDAKKDVYCEKPRIFGEDRPCRYLDSRSGSGHGDWPRRHEDSGRVRLGFPSRLDQARTVQFEPVDLQLALVPGLFGRQSHGLGRALDGHCAVGNRPG
ncbi:MAG: Gfo/Idh/MocA family oxidoreductase [Candidatus Hydrogenedentes bacterium]|nr:Gfo/Idh/MocA family oxidoreductase [Candidatus Hydrogenedentota bacterium]